MPEYILITDQIITDMDNITAWALLIFISLIVGISELLYKIGSEKLNHIISIVFLKEYLNNILIIGSVIIILASKFLIGVPYSILELSIVVPTHHLLIATFSTIFSLIFLK